MLAAWLLFADTDLDTHGLIGLWSVVAFLAAAAIVHAAVLQRGSGYRERALSARSI